eukprot:TRINITY_DN2472_c0_g1_i7.p1 TRINITY_DN2472_c0_g1~~TRINITY_DN2472_c0_g1_i7.p1  ORF type:complete len:371 (-),score=45.31 TRINITY_DN2472_c0_g1_i7:184-1296(-)
MCQREQQWLHSLHYGLPCVSVIKRLLIGPVESKLNLNPTSKMVPTEEAKPEQVPNFSCRVLEPISYTKLESREYSSRDIDPQFLRIEKTISGGRDSQSEIKLQSFGDYLRSVGPQGRGDALVFDEMLPSFHSFAVVQSPVAGTVEVEGDHESEDFETYLPRELPQFVDDDFLLAPKSPMMSPPQNVSGVLQVKGVDAELMSAAMIDALFGLFGNVERILFRRGRRDAFVEYESCDAAKTAKALADKIPLLGAILRISHTCEDAIDKAANCDDEEEELFFGSESTRRFTGKGQPIINPPSKMLLITGIPSDYASQDELLPILEGYGTVQSIKFEGEQNALINFTNLADSIWALVNLQNSLLGKSRIQICFV